MNRITPLFYLAIILITSCQSTVRYYDALCIENITTIDPVDGAKENQTVILKNGKIFKISPTNSLNLSDENSIIDGTGKYMIPGLWDAHVHFSFIEELAPDMFDLFLTHGITSVRDTGGEIAFVNQWKQKSMANPTTTPRVMIAGPLLDGIPNVYDGSDPSRPPLSVGLNTVEDVRKKVNEMDSMGVDLLKAYEMLTPEQFATVTSLGREKGLKVTGHVPLSMDVISASNAGLNSMEHMRNLELSCASNAEELLQQRKRLLAEGKNDPGGILRSRIHQAQRQVAIENYDENQANKVLEVLAKNETWQIPTLTLNTAMTRRYFADSSWQKSFEYLPDHIEQNWNESIERILEMPISDFRSTYTVWMINMAGKVHESSITIMAGTDCPILFLTPGLSLHEELNVLVQAGLSPLDAIKTATINPAKYFNMEDVLGSIKENMWADLVILDANPLEDINNTRQIHAVIKQGNYLDRSDLNEKLNQLSLE
ncbi:amidohydrolase family protein [Ekhidna sp.]|uniref:amidohydrolase family protein n=1 Tax=Ekhidna sp. TaxID=2608089 RepID=UPI003CCC07E7